MSRGDGSPRENDTPGGNWSQSSATKRPSTSTIRHAVMRLRSARNLTGAFDRARIGGRRQRRGIAHCCAQIGIVPGFDPSRRQTAFNKATKRVYATRRTLHLLRLELSHQRRFGGRSLDDMSCHDRLRQRRGWGTRKERSVATWTVPSATAPRPAARSANKSDRSQPLRRPCRAARAGRRRLDPARSSAPGSAGHADQP